MRASLRTLAGVVLAALALPAEIGRASCRERVFPVV